VRREKTLKKAKIVSLERSLRRVAFCQSLFGQTGIERKRERLAVANNDGHEEWDCMFGVAITPMFLA
jgi:hypothetical protein